MDFLEVRFANHAFAFSLVLGVGLGLISGYAGGKIDAFIMRVAEIQLSFPTILIALLIFGVARGLIPPNQQEGAANRAGADHVTDPLHRWIVKLILNDQKSTVRIGGRCVQIVPII